MTSLYYGWASLIFLCMVLQRPGPEEADLPEDCLLRALRQEGISLGGPKEPQLLVNARASVWQQICSKVWTPHPGIM